MILLINGWMNGLNETIKKCRPNMRCSKEQKNETRESLCGCKCLFECLPVYERSIIIKGKTPRADWYWIRIKDCEKHKDKVC